MAPKATPTISDVAREARVSTATVSRALSQPERVSEKTLKVVRDAVQRTGYVINMTARNLRQQRTGAIVVLVPNLGNPFFSHILSGIEAAAAAGGYSVLVANTHLHGGQPERVLNYLQNNRADGLIILDGSVTEAMLPPAFGAGKRLPLVFACEWAEDTTSVTIALDNRTAASLAIGHLADLGHRAIGHVLGPVGNILTGEREAGVRTELDLRGLAVRDDWFIQGDFSLASGASAARRWLELKERPTAMFCANDEMAMGFISELHRNGIETPRDISVVGFDDIDTAEYFIPPLTTVHQPRVEMGEEAARALVDLIDGKHPDIGRIVLPAELVLRRSTARL
jgi:LacI family transcriptional regulator, repressor for deo operon, udp, cdd, tsx, nupC, and nupG